LCPPSPCSQPSRVTRTDTGFRVCLRAVSSFSTCQGGSSNSPCASTRTRTRLSPGYTRPRAHTHTGTHRAHTEPTHTRHTLTHTGTRTHTLPGGLSERDTQPAMLGCVSWSCVNRPAPARAVNLEPGLLTQIDGDSHTGGGSVGRPSSTGGGPEWGPVTRDSEMCGGLAKAPV